MNTGIFGEGFPYSNFHDLNMDWIIKIAKDFLDQYTHIQEIIANGEESLQNLTEEGLAQLQNLTDEGLTQLQNKADNLEALLQEWYNTHSEDIAEQLADALADLNNWYTTHVSLLEGQLSQAILTFNNAADQKTAQSIASIPADYSTVAQEAHNAKTYVDTLIENIENIETVVYSGSIPQHGWVGRFIPNIPLTIGSKVQLIATPNSSYVVSFREPNGATDEQVTYYYGNGRFPVITLDKTYEKIGIYSDNGDPVTDTTYTLIVNKNDSPNKDIIKCTGLTYNGTYSYHQRNNIELYNGNIIGIKITKNTVSDFNRYILYYSKNPNPSSSDFIEATASYFYDNFKIFTVPDYYRALRLVVQTNSAIQTGTVEFVYFRRTEDIANNIIIDSLCKPTSFSVLGDSWSAYKKYLNPSTNRGYYPPWETDVDGQGNNSDVTASWQMWWSRLGNFENMKMRENNSYSGSPICFDGQGTGSTDAKTISFANRVISMIDADLFIIMGGLNDQRFAVNIGNAQYSQWSDSDLSNFKPALCFLLSYIGSRFPKAKILFAIPQPMTGNYKDAIIETCEHYNVPYLEITGMTYLSDHPNAQSQELIAREISKKLVE